MPPERKQACMKIVRHDRYGPPEVLYLADDETPRPGRGEVLVRVAAAALNPKDVLVRKGRMKLFTRNRLPRGSGYDFSGTVVDTTRATASFKPGDEVFGMLNRWDAGTCAEYLLCPDSEMSLRPVNTALEDCAGLPLVCLTSLQALRDLGMLQPGQHVLINGASGGVGAHAVQIAKLLGARVTAVTSSRNTNFVRELGADEVLDYAIADIPGLTARYDVFYDVFGNYHFGRIKPLLKPQGTYVTTVPNARNLRDHLLSRLSRGRQARLVVVYSNATDLESIKYWVEHGQLRPIIDRRYPLAEAVAAHHYLETRRARGKVLLIPHS
jgi:NADPH:quinone reductase-like Zn-dependent oxidoreductase